MTPVASALRPQYERALAHGWVPYFLAPATQFDLRPDVLMAIASRESSMGGRELEPGRFEWLSRPGDSGHGYGLMQIDKRSFPDWVAHEHWRKAEAGIWMGAEVLDGKRHGLVERAGRIVSVRSRQTSQVYKFKMPTFTPDGLERASIAAYNSGDWAAYHASKGRDVDFGTSGKDYSKDVLARSEQFRRWLFADGLTTTAEELPSESVQRSNPDEA